MLIYIICKGFIMAAEWDLQATALAHMSYLGWDMYVLYDMYETAFRTTSCSKK